MERKLTKYKIDNILGIKNVAQVDEFYFKKIVFTSKNNGKLLKKRS